MASVASRLPVIARTRHRGSRDYVLIAILIFAFAVRLYLALVTTYMWDEERDWIPLAESISFQPQNLHLPVRANFHGALPAYFIELGGLLLGKDMLGFRIPSILAGLLTIYLVYRLSLEWTGVAAARWAAVLFAFNEFHISMSSLAIQQSFYLLFAMSSLYAFFRFLKTQSARYLYLTTGLTGLAFLSYEISALLIPVFALALLILPDYRAWFRRKELYLASLIFVVVILPDIITNLIVPGATLATYGDHLSRIGGIGFTPHYLNFYLREGVEFVYGLIGRQIWDKAAGYPTMNLLFGVILLAGVLIETLRWRKGEPTQKFLLLSFWIVLGFFILIRPGAPKERLDPILWLWVDATLLPACILLGRRLAELPGVWRMGAGVATSVAVLVAVLATGIGHFGFPTVGIGFKPEFISPPNGQVVPVRAELIFCKVCDPDPRIEVARVDRLEELDSQEISTSLSGPECENKPRFACTLLLPAVLDPGALVADYEISFRITDHSGNTALYSDRVPVVTDSSMFPFEPKFWVH